MQHWWLADRACTERHGAAFSGIVRAPSTVFLCGELGAGKTTWVRGLLAALGHRGLVKSPSYTLVERYQVPGMCVVHLDLYRLQTAEDLELIGVSEYFAPDCICLVEWPERFAGMLPAPDRVLRFAHHGSGRVLGVSAAPVAVIPPSHLPE